MIKGQRVGAYEILSLLGTGGMGEVYRARDLKLGRDVAIKVLRTSFVSDPDRVHRFNREAHLLAALNHPHIAAIYSLEEFGGLSGLVLELVEGATLSDRLTAGPLPVRDALIAAGQIAEALEAAHQKGILHRDLKPANIKFTSEGAVKVLDFGLAKMVPASESDVDVSLSPTVRDTAQATKHGVILGTTPYMSPEQARGKPVDRRTDAWAFGCVMFEMLSGRSPFWGETFSDTIAAILERSPQWSLLPAATPLSIRRLLERCLEKDPQQRLRDLGDARIEIEQAIAQPGTTTILEGSASSEKMTAAYSSFSRRSALMALVALLIGLVIAVSVWLMRSSRSPGNDETPAIAVLPLANLSGNAANEYLGIGVSDTLISNLAGLSGITVVSRQASAFSPGSGRDLSKIARDLGVDFIVDGGVQQNDQRLKVTARLVRADGSVVWGESYEGSVTELFNIETKLAERLSEALKLRLTETERAKLARRPTTNMEAFADYAQGRALLERPDVPGNIDQAIEMFSAAAKKDRNFALAHAALGEAYWTRYQQTNNPDWTLKAREATLEALRLDPNQSGVRRSLAVIYRGTGDHQTAIEELNRALALQHSDDTLHMMGEILSDQGQIDAAVGQFKQAIAMRPSFWGHYDAMGLALYRAGRFSEAAAAFERVTQLQPDNAVGYQRLGTAYHTAGDTSRALLNYRRALDLAPTPKAYANLGFFYYGQGKFNEAADAYTQALKLDPASHVTYRNMADVYQRLGRREEARAAYEKAIEITDRMLGVNPKDAFTRSQRALYQAKLGRPLEAERDAQAAVAAAPANGQVLYNRAVVHALAEERQAALKALQQALEHGASAALARDDDDLQLIRGTPEFDKLTVEKR